MVTAGMTTCPRELNFGVGTFMISPSEISLSWDIKLVDLIEGKGTPGGILHAGEIRGKNYILDIVHK